MPGIVVKLECNIVNTAVLFRRSGIQENLTTSELRRLIDKLKRQRPAGATGAAQGAGTTMIDYERLCRMLTHSSGGVDSAPHSKAEALLARLQDSYLQSASMGKHFMQLCQLVDAQRTGFITVEELMLTCKMLGCVLARSDIECICDILAENTINLEKNRVNYPELNYAIEYFVPRDPYQSTQDLYDSRTFQRSSGPLNSFAQSASSPYLNASMNMSLNRPPSRGPTGNYYGGPAGVGSPAQLGASPSRSNSNPRGSLLRFPSTDDGFGNNARSSPYSRQAGAGSGYYGREHFHEAESFSRILGVVADRVQAAVEDRSRALGMAFNLKRLFEAFDLPGTGYISVRSLAGCLEDIGVPLAPPDVHAIRNMFGRPEVSSNCVSVSIIVNIEIVVQDEMVDYDALCREILDPNTQYRRNNAMNSSGAISGNFAGTQSATSGNDITSNPRVLDRLNELKRKGVNVLGEFAFHDRQNIGMVRTYVSFLVVTYCSYVSGVLIVAGCQTV
jgi:Ca2+-binding EF-hand superfamily protein